jgi:hypothetical protein
MSFLFLLLRALWSRVPRRPRLVISCCVLGLWGREVCAESSALTTNSRPYLIVVEPHALRLQSPPVPALARPLVGATSPVVALPPIDLAEPPSATTELAINTTQVPPPDSLALPALPPTAAIAPAARPADSAPLPLISDPLATPPLLRDDVPRTIAPSELLPYFVLPSAPSSAALSPLTPLPSAATYSQTP